MKIISTGLVILFYSFAIMPMDVNKQKKELYDNITKEQNEVILRVIYTEKLLADLKGISDGSKFDDVEKHIKKALKHLVKSGVSMNDLYSSLNIADKAE